MITSRIYKATSKTTGKSYIGYTQQLLPRRMSNHKCKALKGSTLYFHQAIQKYGWDDFEWEILFESWDNDFCHKVAEQLIIETWDSLENGYNLTVGGGNFPAYKGSTHPLFGKPRTPEEKAKISANHANVSGANNPRAKAILLVDPYGNKHITYGNFKLTCKKFDLPLGTMHKILYTGILPKTGKAVGWTCKSL